MIREVITPMLSWSVSAIAVDARGSGSRDTELHEVQVGQDRVEYRQVVLVANGAWT